MKIIADNSVYQELDNDYYIIRLFTLYSHIVHTNVRQNIVKQNTQLWQVYGSGSSSMV